MKIGSGDKKFKINGVEITDDTLCSRGGLSLIMRYLDTMGLPGMMEEKLGHLRKSSKGMSVDECVRQFIAFCMDGTKHSIARFDELKKDPGYAAVLEHDTDSLISTAAVKRFFKKFSGNSHAAFRPILNELFLWRLGLEKPSVIVLHLDTMVLDNNDAKQREGCKPTYKKYLAFNLCR